MARFATFETKLGVMGLAWSELGVRRVCLPSSASDPRDALRERLAKEAEESTLADAPAFVRAAAEAIAAHVAGTPHDLRDVPLDLDELSEFSRKVYDELRRVDPGKTVTYAELAAAVGSPGAARAIGHAMATNPVPVIVPCHRVLAAHGKIGGFSAPGGATTKEKLLYAEGVRRSLFPP